jgi:hypothetical protein
MFPQSSIKVQFSAKQIRIEQQMLQEVEFEWLNQFYVQGSRYHAIHSWWTEPMRQLLEYWIELNRRTLIALSIMKAAAGTVALASLSHTPTDPSNWKTDFSEMQNREKKQILKLRKKIEAVEADSFDAISQSFREVFSSPSGSIHLTLLSDPLEAQRLESKMRRPSFLDPPRRLSTSRASTS